MVWGIIGALDKEVELVKNSIKLEKSVKLYGSEWYIGTYNSHKIVVACSGIGKINAAICASTMIREFGAEVIINIGVAGSMTKELGVLDVAISESVAFHDQNPDLFERFYPYQREFIADKTLHDTCINMLDKKENLSFAYKSGRIATGDVFVESEETKKSIEQLWQPLCVEMEGAAIGEAAFINNTPFLVIRTMSDSADSDAHDSFENMLDKAAEISADIVLDLICEYK